MLNNFLGLQIKIWEDRKAQPLLVLRPHDGHPVDAAKFLTAPHRPDHIMLITAVCYYSFIWFFFCKVWLVVEFFLLAS